MPEQARQTFILIRGLTRESAHWGDFVPELQAAFPEARLLQIDLPGAGPFYRETSPATVNGIMQHLRAQALEQGALVTPPVLIAISLGGMAAWEWLLKHPGEIGGAVLINTSLGGLSPFYRRLRWQCYRKLFGAAGNRNIAQREPELLKLLSNRTGDYPKIAADWIAIQQARPVSAKTALRQLYAAASYNPGKAKPQAPVLLLNSLGDNMVSPCCSTAIQQKWGLELRTHPWGGHDLTVDAGAWIAGEIKRWLGGK